MHALEQERTGIAVNVDCEDMRTTAYSPLRHAEMTVRVLILRVKVFWADQPNPEDFPNHAKHPHTSLAHQLLLQTSTRPGREPSSIKWDSLRFWRKTTLPKTHPCDRFLIYLPTSPTPYHVRH